MCVCVVLAFCATAFPRSVWFLFIRRSIVSRLLTMGAVIGFEMSSHFLSQSELGPELLLIYAMLAMIFATLLVVVDCDKNQTCTGS